MASTISAGLGMRRSRIRATRPPYLLRFAKLGPAYGLVVAQHEAADPGHVRLFGPDAVVLVPNPGRDLAQQTELSVTHYRPWKVCLPLGVRGYYNLPKWLILALVS